MGLYRRRPAPPRRPRPTLPVPWPRVAGADFDGTNDYMLRGAGLTGAADGKQGTLSFWLRPDVVSSGTILSTDGGGYFFIGFSSPNLQIAGVSAAADTVLNLQFSAATWAGAWQHVMACWDLSAGVARAWVNGTEVTYVAQDAINTAIDYTRGNWSVGALTTGGTKLDGSLAELWLSLSYLDLSSSANRAKFLTAARGPADLATDGSGPTGTAPIVYLRGEYSGFATNSGTGGDFSVTGTLTEPAWRPGVKSAVSGTILLIVADASHGHTTDGIALSQAHALAVADALHAHATDAILLTQAHVLVLDDALHAHAADTVTLTQAHALIVADAAHAHAADNVVLDFSTALEVADAAHAHAADSLTLSQAHVLAIADAVHAHLADSPALAQQHVLAVSDALHAHLADQLGSFGAVSVATPAGRVFVVETPARVLVVAAGARTLTVAAPARTHTVH